MARLLVVPQIGEVVLTKRRGGRNIRLSISPSGQIRVGLPHWTPYEAGVLFVKKNQDWIQKQLLAHAPKAITNGSRIGKAHRVVFINRPAKDKPIKTRVGATEIVIQTDLDPAHPAVQKKLYQACERALKQEAEELFPNRVEQISQRYELPYNKLRVRKLTSRWGSCSSRKDISLSYYLIQLPWELIDYVILHELSHTIFHNHDRVFWRFMEGKLPNIRDQRKQIKTYKPRVEPY
ncbi:M48 family metallopeptidase [Candidatus Saccharibacteria bacterium]|nr:M48 family metallopeptidase [Candidatus Saccharibacteria bacterium]